MIIFPQNDYVNDSAHEEMMKDPFYSTLSTNVIAEG